MIKPIFTIILILSYSTALKAANWDTLEWQNLLHYHPDSNASGFRSQADDPKFFNAENGVDNPQSEYLATRNAFLLPIEKFGADLHPQCVFPARFSWMRSVDDHLLDVAEAECPKLEKWVNNMQAIGITMVFPAAYINSPSSMFGHTFLRIDSREDKKIGTSSNPLLSRTFSYAAEMPQDVNSWDFVWKGLFGGYPGLMTDAAYYDKVIDYNDIESRDIWEYELDFTEAEILQLIRHTWELQQVVFHYYFFDENCSYRLLSLLDVARSSLQITRQFSTHAIPSDTVRVIEETGIVKAKRYRPSIQTSLNYKKRKLNKLQQKWIVDIVNNNLSPKGINESALSEVEQAQALDFAYEYQRYKVRRIPQESKKQARLSMQILSTRSKLPEADLIPVPEPVSPENGHGSGRWDIAYGEQEGESFGSLRWRPAFHDLLDDDRGYVQGAKINFLSLDVQYFSEQDEFQLEDLSILEIAALNRRNVFFKPISWQISVGWHDYPELIDETERFSLNGGAGLSWELGERSQFSLLGHADIRAKYSVFEDIDAGIGAEATLIVGGPWHSKILASHKELDYQGKNASDGARQKIGLNIPLSNINHAIRLEYENEKLRISNIETGRISFQRYF